MTKEKELELKQQVIELNGGWPESPDDFDIEIKNGKLICRFKDPIELTFISADGE